MKDDLADFIGLRFLHWASIEDYQCEIYRQILDYFTIQYVHSGRALLTLNGTDYEVSPGMLWMSCPGDRFAYRTAVPGKGFFHRYFAIAGPRLDGWAKLGLVINRPQEISRDVECPQIMDRAMRFASIGTPISLLRAANLLENLLLEVNSRYGQTVLADNVWLEKLLHLMESDISHRMCLRDLAEKMNVPQTTLRRKFREVMGRPIHEFRIRKRIDKAEHFLSHTQMSIGEISSRLGYTDVSFFCRQFASVAGMSPGMFRANGLSRM